jgi:hypothetical protein
MQEQEKSNTVCLCWKSNLTASVVDPDPVDPYLIGLMDPDPDP